ncbi:IS66 family insertion sequence element accessory protein TnpB [Anaerovibrio lipolyticus]
MLWYGDGCLLLYKCLDNGRFRWPKNSNNVLNITE